MKCGHDDRTSEFRKRGGRNDATLDRQQTTHSNTARRIRPIPAIPVSATPQLRTHPYRHCSSDHAQMTRQFSSTRTNKAQTTARAHLLSGGITAVKSSHVVIILQAYTRGTTGMFQTTSRHTPTTCLQRFCDEPLRGPRCQKRWSVANTNALY